MKPCQLQSLAILPYLANSKRLRACCAFDKGDVKQICEDPAISNYLEMSAFLTDRLGVRNDVTGGVVSFDEIVKNIDNDRPVLLWLERTNSQGPVNKIVVVFGYHSIEDPYRRNAPPVASLVTFDPWRPELSEDVRIIENRQLVSYPFVQPGYNWVGTIVLLDSPPVKTPQWVNSDASKPYPDDAIQSGTENDQPIYVCRVGENIGKLNNRKCHITYWAGYWSRKYPEASRSSYEVLIGDQAHTSWGPPGKDFGDSVRLNEPDPRADPRYRTPVFLCRATVAGKLFLGMVHSERCVFTGEGERQALRTFDTLNFKRPVTLEFPVNALETELSQQLANAENRFTENLKQLTKIAGTLPDGGTLEGYNVTQVKQAIEQGKLWLLEYLDEPAFAGFKAYVNRFYPLANNLVTFPIKPDQRVARANLKIMNTTKSQFASQDAQDEKEHVLATPGSVDAAIAAVTNFFGKLRANVKAIDLSVVSEPDEAGVELKTELGKLRTTSTNSKFTNVFRGIYSYSVRKNGYKGIQQELNLIDEEGTILKCKLYLSRERDGPYPCSLK